MQSSVTSKSGRWLKSKVDARLIRGDTLERKMTTPGKTGTKKKSCCFKIRRPNGVLKEYQAELEVTVV